MKLRVYLDTSVFSAYYDDQVTDRQAATEEFWAQLGKFDAATSDVARQELAQTRDEALRSKFQRLLDSVTVHPVIDEMRDLAHDYIAAGVFSPGMFNDALHVAAAVMTRQDVMLSWNFRHLVNRRRRSQVNQINVSMSLPTIEIIAPPEI